MVQRFTRSSAFDPEKIAGSVSGLEHRHEGVFSLAKASRLSSLLVARHPGRVWSTAGTHVTLRDTQGPSQRVGRVP